MKQDIQPHELELCLDVMQRIESLASQRDAGNAERVNDVHRGFDDWGSFR